MESRYRFRLVAILNEWKGFRSVLTAQRLHPVGADGFVILWDIGRSNRLGRPLPGRADCVAALAFNSDGRFLTSGGWGKTRSGDQECEGEIHLWSLAGTETSDHVLSGHAGRVLSVSFTRDGKTFKSGSCAEIGNSSCNGIEVRTWDVTTGAEAARAMSNPTP
jgi:WD40 repeat protein